MSNVYLYCLFIMFNLSMLFTYVVYYTVYAHIYIYQTCKRLLRPVSFVFSSIKVFLQDRWSPSLLPRVDERCMIVHLLNDALLVTASDLTGGKRNRTSVNWSLRKPYVNCMSRLKYKAWPCFTGWSWNVELVHSSVLNLTIESEVNWLVLS